MQYLFSAWHEIDRRLKAAGRILLLCDYDGTLAPIVDRPELADLPDRTRLLLQSLSRQGRFTVGVISGRSLADLRHRVSIPSIIYAGNHGLEIEGPGIGLINPLAEEMRPVFSLIHQVLSKALGKVRGVQVEDKGLTLSVHYRNVDEDKTEEVKNTFERVMATARSLGRVRIVPGKKVLEVRPPVDWDKGKAIALLADRFGKPTARKEALPIFLGDDVTDEDGFKAVEERHGISVFVGEETQDSSARYYLKSPAEVEEFLDLLAGPASKRAS